MIILKKWAFLACFLLLVIPCAFLSAAADESAVYYVSQNGDDSADGSSAETAFQTLSAAVSAIGNRDGTVYIVDTAYWSENKSACLVPSYSGVITFEGLHSDSVIDFSRSHAKSTEAADLNLVGSAVFRHITLRTHAHKKIFTYGYDLTMQNVRFTDTENREEKADLVIGKYGKPCTGSRVKIIDSVPLRNIYVGYSRASALTTKTELHILGARVENVILCGMGCTVGNVDLIYQNAWVDKTTVGNNSGEAKIAGHLRVIHNADAFSIEKLSEASPSLYTELHCADGGFVTPLSGETRSDETRSGKTSSDENGGSYSVPDGKTALCTDENQVLFVSAHGGYVRLPDGRKYTVRFSDEPYYTDDGETIRIQNPLSLPFSDGLFLTEKDGLFCGWCYEGQNFGPREADILPSGTVLTAYYEENGVPSIRGVRINIGEKKVRVLADGGTSGGAYEKRYGLLILSADILGKNELLLNQTYPFEESEIAPSVLYSEAASGTYAAETGGIVRERYGERFAARPFVTYTDANGLFRTVYGETRVFSVSDIAKENKISARNERDREMFNMIRQQEREAYYGKNMEKSHRH